MHGSASIRIMSFQQGFFCRVYRAFSGVRFRVNFLLQFYSPSHLNSVNINLVTSQVFGIFRQADSIIVHCRIDKLLQSSLR